MTTKPVFFTIFFLASVMAFAQTEIEDADGNTKVQTEKFTNENAIRIDLDGSERFVIRKNNNGNTLFEVPNTNLNLFIGFGNGVNNSATATRNTFIGHQAGVINSIGQENTFIGHGAGNQNSTGSSNTFLGESAGIFNTTGSLNTFLGESAGFNNTTASENTYIGTASGSNGSTAQFNAFLGAFSGAFNTASGNTFLGHSAGRENTTGTSNTFIGKDAGRNNTTAGTNTFIGASAGLNNTSGIQNTFVGNGAGIGNTTGLANTFVGQQAGKLNTTGNSNTYIGNGAGFSNTTGFTNTFVGQNAGFNNTTGTTNTFIGDRTGQANTTGGSNTFVGEVAGISNTTGTGNTYLGKNAGDSHAANVNCTLLGNGADALLSGMTNSTALGNGAIVNANNKIRFGNTAVAVIEGQVAYTTSDGRFKSKVNSDAPGLEFILGLRPVTYQFDYTKFSDFLGEENVDYDLLREKEQNREMGFIAQDVEQLCAKQGVEISNIVHVPEGEADNYSVAYGQLVVPLVKAVQEQQAEIEALKILVGQLLAERESKAAARPSGADIQVWPNPADEALYVSLPETGANAAISLLSSDGALIRSIPAREGTQKLDMQALPAGTYYVQIINPGQAPVLKAVVKGQ